MANPTPASQAVHGEESGRSASHRRRVPSKATIRSRPVHARCTSQSDTPEAVTQQEERPLRE